MSRPSVEKVRCWVIPAVPEPSPEPAPPAGREFMHGYTLEQIDRLARLSLHMDRWHTATDNHERYDAIHHGIVVHLLTAEAPPHHGDLLRAGINAADHYVNSFAHAHGRSRTFSGEAMPRFERYWATTPTPSPEDRVVDRVALGQILPTLTPRQRQALLALAHFEDYGVGAEACGISPGAFALRVAAARKRFLVLWHEHEQPSKPWRYSRRVSRTGLGPQGQERLTESQVDSLRARKFAGERIADLAVEAGVAEGTLRLLLSGKSRPAPDRESVGAA